MAQQSIEEDVVDPLSGYEEPGDDDTDELVEGVRTMSV
jgi:hypothetical protein